MNKFISEKIKKILELTSSKEYRSYIIKEGYLLDKLGITNEVDLLKFHYISQYVPMFVKRILGKSNKQLEVTASEYLINNFKKIKTDGDIKEIFANYILNTNLIKIAYPNSGTDIDPIKNYNINKWKSALNDIIIRSRVYNNFAEAFTYTTKGWEDMDEKLDFEKWISKQTNNLGKLYKSALYGYEQQLPIDLQHIPGLTPKPVADKQDSSTGVSVADITRKRVLSRINALERILATHDGRLFLGSDYNKIVNTLLELKGDVLRIKSIAMLEDVILRARNSLEKSGCNSKAVIMFTKLAQLPPLDMGDAGMGAPPAPGGGDVGDEGGGTDDGKNAVEQFILNMKGFKNKDMTPNSIEEKFNKIVDDLKKNEKPKESKAYSWVDINTPELKKFEILANGITRMAADIASNMHYNLVSIGQVADAPLKMTTNPVPDKFDTKVETKPIEPVKPLPPKPTTNIDVDEVKETPKDKLETFKLDTKNEIRQKDPVDAAFADIKISDVIVRLEALTRVFKNREIARQMGIIDLMLDRLGLSGFFPSLAEATRSALESNQYCQSRIEEVLSKLVSATDVTGRSIIDESLLEPGKNNKPGKPDYDNIIDKEVASYLDKAPNVPSEPKPVTDESLEKPLEKSPVKPIKEPTPPPMG